MAVYSWHRFPYTRSMANRRLIINADDLGINAQRSHGIFQCIEFGVVTSASLTPNASDSDRAAKHARERGVQAGLHLTLTAEYPLSKAEHVPSLLHMNGMFLDAEKLWSALESGAVKDEDLEREVRTQIEWCFDAYGAPSHIDSHDHIHLHPRVAQALLPLLERYGIRFVRIPFETLPPYGYETPDALLHEAEQINLRALAIRDAYTGSGIASTDHFRGLTLLGNASLKNLRHVLGRLPEGTTELMVHPSSQVTYGTPFDLDPQRQTELRMLLDPTIRDLCAERKIELISFSEC